MDQSIKNDKNKSIKNNKNETIQNVINKVTTTTPAYYSLAITGILTAILIIILAMNFTKLINPKERPYKTMIIIILLGLLIGVHGLLHLGLDKLYTYPKKVFTKRIVFNKKNKQKE